MMKDPEIRTLIVHSGIFITIIILVLVAVFHDIPPNTEKTYWGLVLWLCTLLDVKPIVGNVKNIQE